MSMFTIYLLTRLEALQVLFEIFAFFGGLAVCICILGFDIHKRISYIIIPAVITLILALLAVLTPNNKDLAIIFAANWATNSSEVSKLPDNVVKTMNKFLEEYNQDEKEEK